VHDFVKNLIYTKYNLYIEYIIISSITLTDEPSSELIIISQKEQLNFNFGFGYPTFF
jgi:hypothetical protein